VGGDGWGQTMDRDGHEGVAQVVECLTFSKHEALSSNLVHQQTNKQKRSILASLERFSNR
jgi:hypothetical protein